MLQDCRFCGNPFKKNGTTRLFCTTSCCYKDRYKRKKSEIIKHKAQFYLKNKEEINKKKTIYKRNKIASDPLYKLRANLRARFNKALKGNYKAGSAISDLGCSIDELKIYLEARFQEGMTWDNYGQWHIDHIIPLFNFDLTNPDDIKKVCNYTNLQPLWAKDNLSKAKSMV